MPAAVFVPAELNDLAVDVALTAPARGDVLYRGASKWNNLGAGTSGQFLKTQGAGADPAWATVDLTTLVTLAPGSVNRNRVQPAADANKALSLKWSSATQSAALLECVDDSGNLLMEQILKGLGIGGPSAMSQVAGAFSTLSVQRPTSYSSFSNVITCYDESNNLLFAVGGPGIIFQTQIINPTDIGLFIGLADTQSAAPLAIADFSDGETLFEVDANCDINFYRNPSVPDPVKRTAGITSVLVNNVAATYTSRLRFSVTDHTATRTGLDIEADGSAVRIGVLGAAAAARTAAYTVTNPVTRRSFDTTAVTLSQLAEAVGTIIADQQTFGWFG